MRVICRLMLVCVYYICVRLRMLALHYRHLAAKIGRRVQEGQDKHDTLLVHIHIHIHRHIHVVSINGPATGG